jgi:hypothetical protein
MRGNKVESKKEKGVLGPMVGRVGVDEGERIEQGRAQKGIVVRRRISTHGMQGREAKRVLPRKSPMETSQSSRTRVGERVETKKGESISEQAGSQINVEVTHIYGTIIEGGTRRGWGTLRVPNICDYYREGHRVNRASPTRAKSSLAAMQPNRY